MFTGIVEEMGEVVELRDSGTNLDLFIRARMAGELKVDQSVAHNGVCLTIVEVSAPLDLTTMTYRVTAVEETLQRSNLGALKPGDRVNLERSLRIGDRLDGHMVQGHVDATIACTGVQERDGSWWFSFELPEQQHLLVQKGSICLNGVSLTIAELTVRGFSVTIIPYTYAHTTFRHLKAGDRVNVEFDVLGKYVERMMSAATR
jgi:riboflavin synthase